MENYVKMNLKNGTTVRVINIPEGYEYLNIVGTIVGKSFVDVVDHYIVLFDKELSNGYSAITMPEVCLEVVA